MIITNSKGQRREISEAEARLIKKQGISPDQFFELFPNEDNTNFAGMNIVDYDAFIDSDFQGIEEEPPPRIPAGVSPGNLSDEEMEDFLLGLRGRSQGKDYPTEEAFLGMAKERQFQLGQESARLKRDEDKLALEQYMALQETQQTSALTSDLFKVGLGVEAVAMIMAPLFTVEKYAAKTLYGISKVKDVTKPRIYTPRAKEEVMQNLEKFAADQAKKPGFEPLAQYTRRARDKTYLAPDRAFEGRGLVTPPSATRKYAAAENLLESSKTHKWIDGFRIPASKRLEYDNVSSYHKRYLPRSAFDDIAYQTRTTSKPIGTRPAVREAPLASTAAALLVPFVGSYMSMEDADATGQEAMKRKQALYENASPEVKMAIDKINAGGIETTALEN